MKGSTVKMKGVDWTISRVYGTKSFQLTNDKGERTTVAQDKVVFVSGIGEVKADLQDSSEVHEKSDERSVDSGEKSTTLPPKDEEKTKRGRPQDPNSKLEQCYQIYLEEHDKGRAHTMRVFSERLKISGNCGNTYFYRCKARAVKEGLERTGGLEKVNSK